MAQEGRGNRSSFPDSFFEIDDFDTAWDKESPSGLELMREPSVLPEPGSEVQASHKPEQPDGEEPGSYPRIEVAEEGFEDVLPLIHPDSEVADSSTQPVAAPSTRRTNPEANVTPLEQTRRTGPRSERTTIPEDPVLSEVRDRYAMGDYSGALAIAEEILSVNPDHAQAKRYAGHCRQTLEQMYCAKLGPLTQRPEVAVSDAQLRWLSLDHRTGFLLSLIDGTSSVEELLDISGMPRFEALRTLCDLLEQNVISLAE